MTHSHPHTCTRTRIMHTCTHRQTHILFISCLYIVCMCVCVCVCVGRWVWCVGVCAWVGGCGVWVCVCASVCVCAWVGGCGVCVWVCVGVVRVTQSQGDSSPDAAVLWNARQV
ncbi:hypothetical protein ANANG_G00133710 [Anguilla anguilla]|uniref:Uncharacterized protein n=1 Tax=Anguilla anguilla TaxID=7936 RepID=A0A9D3RXC9_ANGAN|nr:hypothetical protein ANANG_G00133710 [Anguilla anguilla]